MNCLKDGNEQNELLLAYAEGSLPPEEKVACEAHLEACPACRAVYEEHREVLLALERWEAPPVSAGFDARLLEKVRAEEGRVAWWRLPALGWRWGFAAVPVMALALALFLWTRPVAAPLTVAEIEEIETSLADLEALLALQEVKEGEAESL
jgi:anti-sigma factor RsiW